MIRWESHYVFALATMACSAPGAEPLGLEQSAERCGSTYESQHVEQYDGSYGVPTWMVGWAQGPVGYYLKTDTNPDEICSGTLIAKDLFLTAGHCNPHANADEVWFNYQVDPNNVARTPLKFPVLSVVEALNDITVADYAVVQLTGSPTFELPYTRLADDEARVAGLLTIVGHPPVSSPSYKRVSTGPWVPGEPDIPNANWFLHQVDTLPGSSGSGVLRRDNLMVGLHTDAGCQDSDLLANGAVRMTVLLDESPILRQVASMQGVRFANVTGTGGADAIAINFGSTYVATAGTSAFASASNWTTTPFYGDRETLFAQITGDSKPDIIAINGSSVKVRRSTGSGFAASQTFLSSGFFGERATFAVNLGGIYAAIVAVNDNNVKVRTSNGAGLGAAVTWWTGAAYGELGTHMADVNSDGRADLILVNTDRIQVKLALSSNSFGPATNFTTVPFYGEFGTFFADVNDDLRADAIVVNSTGITVRLSDGTKFFGPTSWTTGAYYGNLGTTFADVTGDGRADAIVVNHNGVTVRRSDGTKFTANETWTAGAYYGAQ